MARRRHLRASQIVGTAVVIVVIGAIAGGEGLARMDVAARIAAKCRRPPE